LNPYRKSSSNQIKKNIKTLSNIDQNNNISNDKNVDNKSELSNRNQSSKNIILMKINPENNSPNLNNNIIDLESAVNNIAKNKRNNGNNILIEQDIKISKDCYSCNDLPKINSFEKPDDTNKFVILSKLNNDSYNSSVKIKELNKKIKSKKLELKQNINEDSSKDKSEMNGSTARSNNNDKTTPNKSYDFKSISNFLNDVNSARSTSSINEVVSNLVIDFNKKFQKNEEKFAELESFIEKSIRSLSNQLKNFSSEMVSCNEKDISNFKEVFNHTNINSNLGAPSKKQVLILI